MFFLEFIGPWANKMMAPLRLLGKSRIHLKKIQVSKNSANSFERPDNQILSSN